MEARVSWFFAAGRAPGPRELGRRLFASVNVVIYLFNRRWVCFWSLEHMPALRAQPCTDLLTARRIASCVCRKVADGTAIATAIAVALAAIATATAAAVASAITANAAASARCSQHRRLHHHGSRSRTHVCPGGRGIASEPRPDHWVGIRPSSDGRAQLSCARRLRCSSGRRWQGSRGGTRGALGAGGAQVGARAAAAAAPHQPHILYHRTSLPSLHHRLRRRRCRLLRAHARCMGACGSC